MRVVIILSILLLLMACAPSDENIRIAVAGPMTGPVAFAGEWMTESAELAVEELNAAGGINGLPVKLIPEDTQCPDNKQVLASLNKLRDFDDPHVIIGPFCGTSNFISAKFSDDYGTLFVSPGDNFGRIGSNQINTRYLHELEAIELANHAIRKGWLKGAVLYYNNEWGGIYNSGVDKVLRENGGALIATETFTYENTDVRTQLAKLVDADPDFLIIIDPLFGDLFKQAAELGIDLPLMGTWETINQMALSNNAPALEGGIYYAPNMEETDFFGKFEARYGREPSMLEADTYDAIMLFAKAYESCGRDNACIVEHIASTQNYESASGLRSFNKELWTFEVEFDEMTVTNGEFIPVE